MNKLSIESYEKEEHLLFSAFDEQGQPLDQETCEKLFACIAKIEAPKDWPELIIPKLEA